MTQPPPAFPPPHGQPDPNQWQQMPPTAYPTTPPAAPPKRIRHQWPWLVVGVGLMAVVAGIAIGSEKTPSTPATPTGKTGTAPATGSAQGVREEQWTIPAASLQPARTITAREWSLIAKDPDAHVGERVIVFGQVMQFDATTGRNGFRANVDGIEHKPEYGYADYETNTILHSDDATVLTDIVQDDLFKAEVTVAGTKSYETVLGGTLTAPQLTVTKIDVIGHV